MRKMSSEERKALRMLPISLPRSAFPSDPFSKSSHMLYRPAELGISSSGRMERTAEFRDRLLGIFAVCGQPIPYAFKTADGAIRSLDAGCLGMLTRGDEPILTPECYADGHIRAVRLSGMFVDENEHRLDELVKSISPRRS